MHQIIKKLYFDLTDKLFNKSRVIKLLVLLSITFQFITLFYQEQV